LNTLSQSKEIHQREANLAWVMFGMLSSIASTMIFTVNMLYQARTVGLNPFQLVLVGTVLEVSYFLFEIPTGIIADIYSRRLSIVIGSLMMGVGFMVEGLIPTFAGVLLCQVIWGIGATFHSGAADAWLADEVGEKQMGKVILRADQIAKLAAFFTIIASIAISLINIQLAIVLGGAIHVVNAVYLIFRMPERGFKPAPREERRTWHTMAATFRTGTRVIRGSPVLLMLVAVTFLFGAFSESYDRLWTPHLLENISFPLISGGALPEVIWFGLLSMVGLLFGAVFTEGIRRTVQTDSAAHLARALRGLTVVLGLGVFVFALSANFWLAAAAMFLIGAVRGVYGPLHTTWINQGLEPSVRATVVSTISQADAVGQIAGGPAIGWVGTVFGLRIALSIGALLLSPTLLLLTRSARRQMNVEVVEEVADIDAVEAGAIAG
jgi:DHA3 family tetracycline resistance protein-like MFS transporter